MSVIALCFPCRGLRELFLDDTNITDAAVDAIVMHLRKLKLFSVDAEIVSETAEDRVRTG